MALIQDKKTGELKKLEGKEKENWLKTDRSVEKKGFLNKEQMKRHNDIKESKRQSRKEVAKKMKDVPGIKEARQGYNQQRKEDWLSAKRGSFKIK